MRYNKSWRYFQGQVCSNQSIIVQTFKIFVSSFQKKQVEKLKCREIKRLKLVVMEVVEVVVKVVVKEVVEVVVKV